MFNCTLDSGEWCSLLCCRGPQRRRMSLRSCSKGAPWRRHFLGSIKKMNSNFRYRPPNISLVSFWYLFWICFLVLWHLWDPSPKVLCDPVMENGEVKKVISLSDSRDCSKHWLISDTGLVDLLKRGRQPVIAASSWYMDVQGDQPTLNIERYKSSTFQPLTFFCITCILLSGTFLWPRSRRTGLGGRTRSRATSTTMSGTSRWGE